MITDLLHNWKNINEEKETKTVVGLKNLVLRDRMW